MTRTLEERPTAFSEGLSRADLILVCMPLLFLGGYGVGALAFEGWPAATATASTACVPLMLEGLFVNPPEDG
ncbi:hypothetical protein SAMN04488066_102124 [Halorubrum aquaticum]|uniref:Uncharacterized protein n=1 Tax=Halorubrum aquaticum TaxID=387340 RepID=A0A1I2ZJY5_9EURY|nr:hypothetical protein [Halorubrum aquaticum]SFH37431.1 hypothetical protein SAMN04488066_102124 [Halorubrum aquaticum]